MAQKVWKLVQFPCHENELNLVFFYINFGGFMESVVQE